MKAIIPILCAAVAVTTAAAAQNSSQAPAAAVTALADAFVAATFERYPEAATFLGLPDAQHDRITDNSAEAYRAWDKRVDGFAVQLRAIERGALAGRPEAVTYGYLWQAIETEVDGRVCRSELWSVDQMNGWQVTLPAYLMRQPVATESDRRAALARIRQYSGFIDREIAMLRRGLEAGYTAPRVSVDRVISQIESMLAAEPAKSPFASAAARANDAAFARELTAVVQKEINPALARYRSFLGEYQGVARTTVGVESLPNGDACYRALMRSRTSLDLSADEVHQLGLTMMEQIHGEMRTIAARSFGTSDVPALLERLRSDRSLRFTSGEEMTKVAEAAMPVPGRRCPGTSADCRRPTCRSGRSRSSRRHPLRRPRTGSRRSTAKRPRCS